MPVKHLETLNMMQLASLSIARKLMQSAHFRHSPREMRIIVVFTYRTYIRVTPWYRSIFYHCVFVLISYKVRPRKIVICLRNVTQNRYVLGSCLKKNRRYGCTKLIWNISFWQYLAWENSVRFGWILEVRCMLKRLETLKYCWLFQKAALKLQLRWKQWFSQGPRT